MADIIEWLQASLWSAEWQWPEYNALDATITTGVNPWLATTIRDRIPKEHTGSVIAWMERNVRLVGSALSERMDFSITPWTREPVEAACSGDCRRVTFIKPVQAGGSSIGEAALCYQISTQLTGDVQYNWPDDEKFGERWDKYTEKRIKACKPVMALAPSSLRQDGKWKRGQIIFTHCNFAMQGVWSPKNLDSDTIAFQVNEEVHGWKPGHLAKADNRQTAVWNRIQFNISNAGRANGQLHQRFNEGTQRQWEVLCPGCGKHHPMRTRWDTKRPDLGGLRYDADGCRMEGGFYNYNRLEATIRYQMPCGAEIKDDRRVRRQMSLGGRYGEPQNRGARPSDQSFILEAVAVDYIPWLTLIQEKHAALRAMRLGDPEPWWRYLAERECQFYNPEEDRPVVGSVVVNLAIKKTREGLQNRVARFGAADRQRGTLKHGELPHWWVIIRDVDAMGNSLLVFEGKMLTDDELGDVFKRHEVKPTCVVLDSGDWATHVYQTCFKFGFNAIKGSGEPNFIHPDGGRKIFSPEKPLHLMLNRPRTRENFEEEPLFWHYSKSGIRDRMHWLRGADGVKWEVPGDVSEDYKSHMESEELEERRHPRTNEVIVEWVQRRPRNDLFVCEAYVVMLMEMAGLIGG